MRREWGAKGRGPCQPRRSSILSRGERRNGGIERGVRGLGRRGIQLTSIRKKKRKGKKKKKVASVGGAENTYLHGEGEGARKGSRHQSKGSRGIQAERPVKPGGTIRRRAAGSHWARPAGAGSRSRSGSRSPGLGAEPEQRGDAPGIRGGAGVRRPQQRLGRAEAQQGSRGSGEGAQATVPRRGAPSPTSISDGGN